ncbi:MAG: CoA pyrophosphatase [Vicinamibacteria bacterium]
MARTGWLDVKRALAVRPSARVSEHVRFKAAVAVVLRDGDSGLDVLFIRRAEHPADPWSGQMAFPGGRSEPGDTDLRGTAMRETAEETGIDLEAHGECLGALDEVRALSRMRPMDLTIQPFVFRLLRPCEEVLSDEVVGVHWLPLDDLLGPAHRDMLDYSWNDQTLRLPCFRIDGRVIWGLTYRMFANLEDLLEAGAGAATRP